MELKTFVKKQIEILPLQFTGENFVDVVEFTKGKAVHSIHPGSPADVSPGKQAYDKLTLTTIHEGQTVDLVSGDWIIPEQSGEDFYPCKPEVFKITYVEKGTNERAVPLKDVLIAVGNWLQTDDVWIADKPGGNKIDGFIESKPGTLTSRLTNPNQYRGEVINESGMQRIRKIVEETGFDETDIIGSIKEILNEGL